MIKRALVLLLVLSAVFAQAPAPQEKGGLIKGVLNAAINLLSGKGSTKDLEQFKDLVKTKETAEISGMIEDNGFKSIQVKSSFNNAAGIPKPLAINILNHGISALFPKIVGLIDAKTEAIIQSAIEMCKLFVEFDGQEHEFMDFGLQFKNAQGRVNLIKLHLQQNDGAWDFFTGFLDGTFVKAPSFLIVQKAKGNLFSSKSWVELVPIQRGVTEHDIARFFAFVAPAMGAYRPPEMANYQPNAMIADSPPFDGMDDFDEEDGADFDDYEDEEFDDDEDDEFDEEDEFEDEEDMFDFPVDDLPNDVFPVDDLPMDSDGDDFPMDFDGEDDFPVEFDDLAEGEEDDVADFDEGEYWEPSFPIEFPKPVMPFPNFPPFPGQGPPDGGEEPEDPSVIQYPGGGLSGLGDDEAEEEGFGFFDDLPSFDDWTPVDQEIEDEAESEVSEDTFASITQCIQACKEAIDNSGVFGCNKAAKECKNVKCGGRGTLCKLQCKIELANCIAGLAGAIDECTAACK